MITVSSTRNKLPPNPKPNMSNVAQSLARMSVAMESIKAREANQLKQAKANFDKKFPRASVRKILSAPTMRRSVTLQRRTESAPASMSWDATQFPARRNYAKRARSALSPVQLTKKPRTAYSARPDLVLRAIQKSIRDARRHSQVRSAKGVQKRSSVSRRGGRGQ